MKALIYSQIVLLDNWLETWLSVEKAYANFHRIPEYQNICDFVLQSTLVISCNLEEPDFSITFNADLYISEIKLEFTNYYSQEG